MINIDVKTEFSFKKAFGFIDKIVEKCEQEYIGIADYNVTFGHTKLEQACKKFGKSPIYGVRISVSPEPKSRSGFCDYILIAKNNSGLSEVYEITSLAWKNFYYVPQITTKELSQISKNVFVICDGLEVYDRADFIGVSPKTPHYYKSDIEKPKIALSMNRYPDVDDKPVYQLIAGVTKRKDEYYSNFESSIYPQHILSEEEWVNWCGNHKDAIENTHFVAKSCKATLQKAPNVRYQGTNKKSLQTLCFDGAKELGIDLWQKKDYANRLKKELDLIKSKDFEDYFLIVSDLIRYAKSKSFVGPARGSAAGSLVCYLTGITTVDPIKFNLLFERFIDSNREDFPDIDIDFTDTVRDDVIMYLIHTYGHSKVAHIANINRLKPKSAIGLFALGLGIPPSETADIKDAMISRSSGDARASLTMVDTFDTTEIGKKFLEKNPEMKIVSRSENHASHTGVHAAGIIVCPEPLTKYIGVNYRENMIMGDKKDAEYLNLLKIDCLGLRTLSVLEECAKLANFNVLDFYKLQLDDKKAFDIFNQMRVFGIFQFEGQALQYITRNMGVQKFDDIVAITALARPGPMHSGGANKFISRRIGKEEISYISDHESYVDVTKDTYGIVVYQEQLMRIAREYGQMSWMDVQELRRGAAKSMGVEFFNRYKEKFIEGAIDLGRQKDEADEVWENIVTFGSWAFNKSHAVSYALISYWTAWAKAHYPLEFTVANLRHSKTNESALRILRDAVKNEGYDYEPYDPDLSEITWSVKENKIIGGFINIDGIGNKKAASIVKKRDNGHKFTPSELKAIMNGVTPFDVLYPTEHYWGHIKSNHHKYGIKKTTNIEDIDGEGEYTIICRLNHKDVMDLNEYNTRAKRGGEYITENSTYLKLVVEDDTDQIQCRINRFDYPKFGAEIAETAIDGETWFVIYGYIKGEWRAINVKAIYDLTRDKMGIFK